MKVFLGVSIGIVVAFMLLFAGCTALVAGTANEVDKSVKEAEKEAKDNSNKVKLSAKKAGTVTDEVDGTEYTVVEVTVDNGGKNPVDVSAFEFSAVSKDGVVSEEMFETVVGMENPIDMVTAHPGDTVTGEIAVRADTDLDKIRWEPSLDFDGKHKEAVVQ